MSDPNVPPEPAATTGNDSPDESSLLQKGKDWIMEKLEMGASWVSAEWIWINHGMPFREMNDVNHLYYRVCKPCPYFLNDGCMICRCRLVPNELSGLNKLSMATTNCPLPAPKWISSLTPPEGLDPEVAAAALKNVKANLVEIVEDDSDLLADQPMMTVSEIKKKQEAAVAVNPFTRTATGQYVQGDHP